MKHYIGYHLVTAEPMTRWEYCEHRGWDVPADENGSDPGHLIHRAGDITWVPDRVFQMNYRSVEADFDFSAALILLKEGRKVARRGWNGKNMYVYFVNGSQFTVNRQPLSQMLPEGTIVHYRGHFDMFYADGTYGVWVASHSDLTANDWHLAD